MRRAMLWACLVIFMATNARLGADDAALAPVAPGGKFAGIGAVLGEKGGLPVVTEILPTSPAASSGLQLDDLIVRVDYRDLKGMKLTDVVNLIRG